MELNQIEFLSGLFSLIFIVITTFLGLFIAYHYKKSKQITLLYVGFALPCLSIPWYPSSISFLMILFTGQGLSEQFYFFIGNAFIPIFLLLWMIAMTQLIFNKKKKSIILIYIIIGIMFESTFIFYLITNPRMIGILQGPIDVDYYGFTQIYLIFVIASILFTAIWVGLKAGKAEKAEIRLKGKFIILGDLLWVIAAAADAFVPLNIISLLIIRMILILSILLIYNGWILNEYVKNIFLKRE
jgi:hypothetical protein